MTNPGPSSLRPWIIAFTALAINLVIGALYAWGVIAKALVTQWGWTKTQASLPFTVSTATFAVTMIFAGRLQDRMGPRLVATLGGIMFGVGLISSSFFPSPDVTWVTFGIVGGIGIGLGYSATTPPAIKWFAPSRKGLVTGIVVSGVGLAAVYVSPLTQWLLRVIGISQTFLVLGIGAIALVTIFSAFLRNPPPGYRPPSEGRTVSAPAAAGPSPNPQLPHPELDWHEMLRTPRFYQLWSMFALGAAAGLMIIAHIAIIAKEQAHWEWGFVPLTTLAIFNTLGRVVSGYLSDRIGRPRTMILAFIAQAVNMFLFTYYTNPALLIFGSAFTGLCYGTIFTLMPAATADFYGVRNLGVNYGFVFTAFGVAGVLGPTLAALIRDRFGSYAWSYSVCAILLVIGATIAFFTEPSVHTTKKVDRADT